MGLFSQIFGRNDEPETYRNEMQRQSNRLFQIERVSAFLEELTEEAINPDQELQFQCIFTTNTIDKAKSFKDELAKIDYKSEWRKQEDSDYEILGYTRSMKPHQSTLLEWTSLMCELGEAHDCEFASWLPVRPGEER